MAFRGISLSGISKVGKKAQAIKAKPKPPPKRQLPPSQPGGATRAKQGIKLKPFQAGGRDPLFDRAPKPKKGGLAAVKPVKKLKPVIKSKPKGKVPRPKF